MARALFAIVFAFAAVEGALAANTTGNATMAPTTTAAATEAPGNTTMAPTTEAPTTEAPTTEAPTTEAPTTEAGNGTVAPTTEAPTTEAPTTEAPTTEAPTTEAPTTEAPMTEGNSTTPAAASSTVTGSITLVAPGLNQSTIEASSTTALALHFDIAEDKLSITVVESRRLGMDDNSRNLAGTFAIAYVLQVSPAQLASVNEKVAAAASDPDTFKSTMTTKVKAALTAAGVDASQVTVSAVTVPVTVTTGVITTTTMKDDVVSAAAGNTLAFISLVTVTKMLFSRT